MPHLSKCIVAWVVLLTMMILVGPARADKRYTYDENLLVKASGAVTADTNSTALYVGAGLFEADMVVDVAAVEVNSVDDYYKLTVQGCSTADCDEVFEDIVSMELGAQDTLGGNTNSTAGRYILPFLNTRNNTVFPYIRLNADVDGTIATGITYRAFIGAR